MCRRDHTGRGSSDGFAPADPLIGSGAVTPEVASERINHDKIETKTLKVIRDAHLLRPIVVVLAATMMREIVEANVHEQPARNRQDQWMPVQARVGTCADR